MLAFSSTAADSEASKEENHDQRSFNQTSFFSGAGADKEYYYSGSAKAPGEQPSHGYSHSAIDTGDGDQPAVVNDFRTDFQRTTLARADVPGR